MTDTIENNDGSTRKIEQWVLDACQDLGLAIEGAEDDFFAAGGTSLTLIRLIARAEDKFAEGCLLPDDMYEHSSIRGIAATILRNSRSAVSGGIEQPTLPTEGQAHGGSRS